MSLLGFNDHQVRTLKILCGTFPSIVFSVTAFRLYLKGRSRWWWDDAFASFGVICMSIELVVSWYRTPDGKPHVPSIVASAILNMTSVYLARYAILLSIIKLATVGRPRNIAHFFLFFFAVCWTAVLIEYLIFGSRVMKWNIEVPVAQLIASLLCDSILVILPLHIIRALRNDNALKHRLQVIFMASAVTSFASLAQLVTNLMRLAYPFVICLWLESWISLLVCNFGIITTAVLKRFESFFASSSSAACPPSTMVFSTGRSLSSTTNSVGFDPTKSVPEVFDMEANTLHAKEEQNVDSRLSEDTA